MDSFSDSQITQSSLQPINLFNDDLSPDPSSTICDEKLATFLRIRPLDNIPIESTPYSIIDSNRLCVEIEEKISVYNNGKKAKQDKRKVVSFNHIFDSTADQQSVFTKCCLPLVNDVLEGTNALLFCFGTTSSGKSYTMRGPPDDPTADPGLIPLSLKKIFSSRKFVDEPLIGRSKFSDISVLDEDQQLMEKQFKEAILSSSCCRNVSAFSSVKNKFSFNEDGYQYICYLSYFEIYNGLVYDLLLPSSGGRGSPLSLFPDDKQRYFVKDLKSVMVSTLTEALQIYSFGWTNLQRNIQETGLNKNSSRSHSFLCITLIKFKEDEGQLLESQVSHLTLGDLAGSERQNKTHSEGMRVKEGGNINVSLMHLKECFNQTKLSQKNPNRNFVIPFRNSSLTKFFQPYLTGTGRVWMIININPSPALLHETCGSLDLGETAAHISVNSTIQLKLEESKRRMTQVWLQSSQRWSSFTGKYKTLDVPQVVIEADGDDGKEDNCDLVQPDGDFINRIDRDEKIRTEVIAQFEEILKELMQDHERDIQLTRDNYEKTMEARLALSDRKYQAIINNLQSRNEELTTELFKASETIVQLEEEMKKPAILTEKLIKTEFEVSTKEIQTEIEESNVSPVVEVSSVEIQTDIDDPIIIPSVEMSPCETQTESVATLDQEGQTETKYVPQEDYEALEEKYQKILTELSIFKEKLETSEREIANLKSSNEFEVSTKEIQTDIVEPIVEPLSEPIVEPILVTPEIEVSSIETQTEIDSVDTTENEAQTETEYVALEDFEKLKETYQNQLKELEVARKTLEKRLEAAEKEVTDSKVSKEMESKPFDSVDNSPNDYIQSELEIDDDTVSPKKSRPCGSSGAEMRSAKQSSKYAEKNVSVKKSREITIDTNYLPASVCELTKRKRKEETVASPSTEITNEYLKMMLANKATCPPSTAKKSAKRSAKPPRKSTKSSIKPEPEVNDEEDDIEEDELASLLISQKKGKKKNKEEESTIKIPTKRKKIPINNEFLEVTISPSIEDEPLQEPNIKGGRVLRPRRKIKF